MLTSNEIRRRFLAFFSERGHTVIPSASLVPQNDPTVLFTTAGMHPLVPYLLGEAHPQGERLASVQKCVRTQDIDEVGDNRHNTFFEMLGNWSLGDYFKEDSIAWSWEFLTDPEKGLGLDPQRLYVTVFAGDAAIGRDDVSIGIWKEQFATSGISAEVDKPLAEGGRIFTMDRTSNWWGPPGLTGPCGPDTEIYYDLGEHAGAATTLEGMPDFDSGRLLEIWNNVFMQFFQDDQGNFQPLSQQNVDTGMGLERIATVLQGVETVFETDLFQPILTTLREVLPESAAADSHALYIVADHLRTSTMLVTDGVEPSNKGRGYVLRRLIRRASLYAETGDATWIGPVVERVAELYADTYPNVTERLVDTERILTQEAQKFYRTLEKGKQVIAKLETISGTDAFDLYQSYGFPLELTKEYAEKRGLQVDEAAFYRELEKHQELSRTASQGQFASGLADNSETTVKYHTATHLLHQALREVLGEDVAQKGSNITPERLRFDFTYPQKLTEVQLAEVEQAVNARIAEDLPVHRQEMSPEEAREQGAIGLFGDKYGDVVTVYSIGSFSKEICTGPHVERTGVLGTFEITKEEAVSAGVRRIKAILR